MSSVGTPDLLVGFVRKYGDRWPREALERLIQLACQGADVGHPEYDLLYEWILSNLEVIATS